MWGNCGKNVGNNNMGKVWKKCEKNSGKNVEKNIVRKVWKRCGKK